MTINGYEIAVRYAEALTDKFTLDGPFGGVTYTVDKGRKYHRIVQTGHSRTHDDRSVHAFVTNDGKLAKPGGWVTPQRDKGGLAVRYDLSTPHGFMEALDRADWAGGYLYK